MADADLIVGATVAGKYRIRRVIGRGSMGVVCEAQHLEIGKRVAIKLIDTTLTGMKDVAARFRREARATGLAESHHIVHVFDVGSDDQVGLYLVMEYLTGEDLAQLLAREKQLEPARAVRIALQVARGLAKAHEAGVVHRDLKPANIFLCAREDDEPLVKILDFGISKVVDSARAGLDSARVGVGSALKLTRAGTVVGTPQYMSPEQAQGYPVDERTDIWALGVVLYEMLAGRPAYPELPTYEQFIIHLVSQAPEPLRGSAPWVPDELASIVHAAVEHDLSKRIKSSAALVERLTGLTSSAPRAPAASKAPSAPSAPPPEDFGEDAPQFFDRKLLGESLGPLVANGVEDAEDSKLARSTTSASGTLLSAVTPAPAAAPARRTWMWPTIIVVAFALVAVAAFAFR
jgi:eukaryotic-like serine/threonine-protein kinase